MQNKNKEGVALVGETAAKLSTMYGEGAYQIRIMSAAGCRVSENYIHTIPSHIDTVYQTICEGDELLFGTNRLTEPDVYVENFISSKNCDSLVTLYLEAQKT